MATDLLFRYAKHVPNETIYPIFYKYFNEFGSSKITKQRVAASLILGHLCIPEALLDKIRDDLTQLANFVVDLLQDPKLSVRKAIGETVGKMAENCTDEFVYYHEKILPLMIKVFYEFDAVADDITIQKLLNALEEFINHLEYDIKPYVEDLIKLNVAIVQGECSS